MKERPTRCDSRAAFLRPKGRVVSTFKGETIPWPVCVCLCVTGGGSGKAGRSQKYIEEKNNEITCFTNPNHFEAIFLTFPQSTVALCGCFSSTARAKTLIQSPLTPFESGKSCPAKFPRTQFAFLCTRLSSTASISVVLDHSYICSMCSILSSFQDKVECLFKVNEVR